MWGIRARVIDRSIIRGTAGSSMSGRFVRTSLITASRTWSTCRDSLSGNNENLGNKIALAATDGSAGRVAAESQRRAARMQDETFVLGIDAAPW